MRLTPRSRCEVTALSPGVQALLRGVPRAPLSDALHDRMKGGLLAAYARAGGGAVSASPGRDGLLRGYGLSLTLGASAAVAVFAGGLALGSPSRAPSMAEPPAWETVHPLPQAAAREVRIVKDPRPTLGLDTPMVRALDPQDGP